MKARFESLTFNIDTERDEFHTSNTSSKLFSSTFPAADLAHFQLYRVYDVWKSHGQAWLSNTCSLRYISRFISKPKRTSFHGLCWAKFLMCWARTCGTCAVRGKHMWIYASCSTGGTSWLDVHRFSFLEGTHLCSMLASCKTKWCSVRLTVIVPAILCPKSFECIKRLGLAVLQSILTLFEQKVRAYLGHNTRMDIQLGVL